MTSIQSDSLSAPSLLFEERCAQSACRSCGHRGLTPVLDLGLMPLSDGLLRECDLDEEEPRYPLELAFCSGCSLVQILETVPPEELFGADYPYFSSYSETLLEHSREHALTLLYERGLDESSLVVELASNDGYLLRNFVENDVPVLGIDPAPGPAAAAEAVGVPTLVDFFGADLATRLAAEGRRADVVLGNNVLAHVADTNGFVRGIRAMLKDDGIAELEFPYVRDLVEQGQFDTIYHEHLCYFSAHALDALFRRNGLFLNRVTRIPIHGGSLRIRAARFEDVEPSVTEILEEERELGLDGPRYYRDFGERVARIRYDMLTLLSSIVARGQRIAAYGAAAKGTIMLNYLGLGVETIAFVVDRNEHKQGKWMPGVRIPILAPEELLGRRPDYAVILPWNFKDEIVEQQAAYLAAGGQFIVPIPSPAVC